VHARHFSALTILALAWNTS